MEQTIAGMEADANALDQRAQATAEKQENAQAHIGKLKEQMGTIKSQELEKKAQITDLTNLAQDYSELRNKWVKEADKKKMDALIKVMDGTPEKEQVFIMDSLAQFFSSDENATYESTKEEYFKDKDAFDFSASKSECFQKV